MKMDRNYEIENLKQIVLHLRTLKREGGYWDFKKEYHTNKAELLLDIICMANNQEDRDSFIIFGIEDHTMKIVGVENDRNRRKLNQLSQFLSGKSFAVYVPEIDIQTIEIEGHEIDVLIIFNTNHTPYYLEKDFIDSDKTVLHGEIYIRLNDRKAGTSEASPYSCIEHLWKKRFGIELSIMERLIMRLDEYDRWEFDWGNKKYAFHQDYPEFRMVIEDEFRQGWLPATAFYIHPVSHYARLNLMYHNTIIYETVIWSFDEFRKYLPEPESQMIEFRREFWYLYYDLSKIEGKLLRIMTKGHCNISSREPNRNQILIFENQKDRKEFETFFQKHFNDYSDEEIREEYKYQLREDNEDNMGGGIFSSFQVAKTAKIYEKWCEETNKKYYKDWSEIENEVME